MSKVKAVLGPTNTGKTHYAVERMLAYTSGVMGFPLRLLAREVYDRVVAVKGKRQVALLTGEERIVPEGARYFLCTAEAMPRQANVEFVALDEVQMAADLQRGHVFTEHLLHTRGRYETLLLGSSTMEAVIRRLVPDVEVLTRPRFSNLSYSRPKKLSRLARRSAIVGFSSADVYGLAELMRRQKGGVAIVMGALSPRTRNAQVEMYQSGEVEYLVATDAIGMGLNMDIDHVAFAGLSKFDGRVFRNLTAAEAGQIAGRAGRYKRDGSFSTLGGDSEPMPGEMIEAIEEHAFDSVKNIQWRNNRLDFATIPRLIRSLEMPATLPGLHRTRDAVDMAALVALSKDTEIQDLVVNPSDVQTLWDVCSVPDFRKLSVNDHHAMLRRLFTELCGKSGTISHDWIASQVKRLDNTHGDIDTLATRIASIRVWTYISHRSRWLEDAAHWAHVTRGVEDKLSDALHEKLTQRFVDRRTAVLMRSLRQRDTLSVSIDNDTNQVAVEGHTIGELKGFSFQVEAGAARDDQKTLKSAAESALKAEITRRAKLFNNIGHKNVTLNFEDGLAFPKMMWDDTVIATIHKTGAFLAPRVKLAANTLLDGENAELVLTRAQEWLDTRIAEKLEPLVRLAQELNGEIEAPEGAEALSGITRGVAYQLVEHYGVLPRAKVAKELRQLDQEARKGLRRFGIRIGAANLYMPLILKPHATELRLMMWAMDNDLTDLPDIPTPGMVWTDADRNAPRDFYALAGFRLAGKKAVRMDMSERLADTVRPLGQGGDWFEVTPEIMGLVGLSGEDFAAVMSAIGYSYEARQVENAKPAPVAEEAAATEASTEEVAAAETEATEPTPATDAAVAEDAPAQVTAEEAPEEASEPAVEAGEASTEAEDASTDEAATPELVERYFFRWSPKRRPAPDAADRGRKPGPANKQRKGAKGQSRGPKQATSYKARPPKKEKQMDPDSPFAALAGLKESLSSSKK
ncbi:ATP-dependent helicase MgpS [Kordiimonas sediminis]|uniref:ATP-dependent helicase MgpS n=1 Tax=Kordiimonas sediminis TaxID=1735581 RepID=A0A919AM31_9PROT|nr:helicase-related protein [Kordiimonas sediminis]GHF14496.1 ATP-dependent helicase MgpS [Kordiimonas sediminis]